MHLVPLILYTDCFVMILELVTYPVHLVLTVDATGSLVILTQCTWYC